MSKIGFIVPTEDMLACVQDTLREYPDIRLQLGLVTEATSIAEEFVANGAEIIIARGATAQVIRNSQLPVTVVEVPVTSFDIIRAVEAAKQYGAKIAVVTFSSMGFDVAWLGRILGVSLIEYAVVKSDDVESAILKARADGAASVLGGGVSVKIACEYGMPSSLITMGREAILQVAQQARQIREVLELDKVKHGLMTTVLDHAYEGIITIDSKGIITIFNPTAERLTKIHRSKALGSHIYSLWPELNLETVIRTKSEAFDEIVEIAGNRLICNKIPIIIEKRALGVVATLQETRRIEKMEAVIRRQVHARGHVAKFHFSDILGKSKAVFDAIEVAKNYAEADSSILILGKTGTGKEIFAQSIHNHASRSSGPFVAINCAALPSQILESELFGYVNGAFTGASRDGKPGLFELAHNGTLFLDEIGEMDYLNQSRLLRFLQEKTVRRLGSDRNIPINVRIIAATNKDLELLIQEKRFRDDLFYRLNVLSITLPPLRERTGDIKLLTEAFLKKYSKDSRRNISIEAAAIKKLEDYPWPGNVRELENFVERLVITTKSNRVNINEITALMNPHSNKKYNQEKILAIKDALATAKGKYSAAAKILGVDRSTLWRWLKQNNMK